MLASAVRQIPYHCAWCLVSRPSQFFPSPSRKRHVITHLPLPVTGQGRQLRVLWLKHAQSRKHYELCNTVNSNQLGRNASVVINNPTQSSLPFPQLHIKETGSNSILQKPVLFHRAPRTSTAITCPTCFHRVRSSVILHHFIYKAKLFSKGFYQQAGNMHKMSLLRSVSGQDLSGVREKSFLHPLGKCWQQRRLLWYLKNTHHPVPFLPLHSTIELWV